MAHERVVGQFEIGMKVECGHIKTIRIPYFPDDRLVCADCGHEMPLIGYANGIREYYVPGDPPWRRLVAIAKLLWADGRGDDLQQCPECCFAGTLDDFDVIGSENDHLFCNGNYILDSENTDGRIR